MLSIFILLSRSINRVLTFNVTKVAVVLCFTFCNYPKNRALWQIHLASTKIWWF